MVSLSTWCRYLASKLEYSLSLSLKSYKKGQISNVEVGDTVWRHLFQGKLTYLHWSKGVEMAPTIGDQGGTLLVRKLPTPDTISGLFYVAKTCKLLGSFGGAFRRVFVGDVVVLKDPQKSENFLVRRLAATEGYEMVSTDEKEEPFVLDEDQCWVLADNEKLKPKEANDSRTFGPVPMSDIVGRVIYCLRNAVDHGPVQNRQDSWIIGWWFLYYLKMHRTGYGPLEGRCLPRSGLSGRVGDVSPRSRVSRRICSQVMTGSVECALRTESFVCKASPNGRGRNSDFGKQNRQNFQNRNRQNENRDSFGNLDESSENTSKNEPFAYLSESPNFQATASPGPVENEILELLRKIQEQLREKGAVKTDKKVKASQEKGKEDEIDTEPLLEVLKKHNNNEKKSSNSSTDQVRPNGFFNKAKKTSFLDSRKGGRNSVPQPNSSSPARPPSNFRRRSPIPHLKFQPIYSSEDSVNSAPYSNSSDESKHQLEMPPDAAQLPELETEALKPELESSFDNGDMFNEAYEEDASDTDQDYEDQEETEEEDLKFNETYGGEALNIDQGYENQQQMEEEDLSSMKMAELRELAKSRGLKGYSKMKKIDLVELLSSSSA
ncbi:hypothetical protein Tsubulata_016107 [Turnera subulata]|uniref:Rho termination factor-like N-terminal domain-containing protein n=1 Tax=Turnera subulata TaxID=218843 RepID=A0A9Q0F6M0_9ROSI|nr:hypothetical protein Tsubulata_016107 [Turnera subulata]